MPNQLKKTWNYNHGNMLLILGFIAGVTMSTAWHMNLLPDFAPAPRSFKGTSRTVKLRPRLVVVTVDGHNLPSESGGIYIFLPEQELSSDAAPIYARTFEFDASGLAAFVISDLQPGSYSAVVYCDSNSNGVMDFNESGNIVEPFSLSWNDDSVTDSLLLRDSTFSLETEPVFLKFEIGSEQAKESVVKTK